MRLFFRLCAFALGAAAMTAPVLAQDAIRNAITARQSLMHLYAFNLGQLGAMAKGEMAYDAETASVAAGNLARLTSIKAGPMFPPGSDNATIDKTRALPALWQNLPDVGVKQAAVAKAAAAMEAAAGDGLPALQAAIGPLGQACGACHKAYRAPED
ncbi:MAG: cytochrome c [Rhodobacteraceae bacterium]|nr:cytochrome c [Paracoccaceae bacterium]